MCTNLCLVVFYIPSTVGSFTLETTPTFTVRCDGRESLFSQRESNPGSHAAAHHSTSAPRQLHAPLCLCSLVGFGVWMDRHWIWLIQFSKLNPSFKSLILTKSIACKRNILPIYNPESYDAQVSFCVKSGFK